MFIDGYRCLGPINLKETKEELRIPLADIPVNSFAAFDKFFIGKINGDFVAYDAKCDHNGGTLFLDSSKCSAICPIHNWEFNLLAGKYSNGCSKLRLPSYIEDNFFILQRASYEFPEFKKNNFSTAIDSGINFKFNAHASVSIEIADYSIISDPWLDGPCCATGWWHSYVPTLESIGRLKNSNLIYISHNHPDHLHLPTLNKHLDKDKLFLIPNYESKSVERILRSNGFNNLIILDFLQKIAYVTQNGTEVEFVLVKSGDERDDSGLIINANNKTIFLGVDTNQPNNWILPKCDILFSPFASGASCFPSCIENFNDQEKIDITNKNKTTFLSNHVEKLISATQPDYFFPYAGYFSELGRDKDISKTNKKNSISDVQSYLERFHKSVKLIDPYECPAFKLGETFSQIQSDESPLFFLDDLYINDQINTFSRDAPVLSEKYLLDVGNFFFKSNFIDSLSILLIVCDDNFSPIFDKYLYINFSKLKRGYSLLPGDSIVYSEIVKRLKMETDNNIEIIKIRSDALRGAFMHGTPIEDLTSGWQMRMYRSPNVYNFKFYDYFTNISSLILV